MRRYSYASPEMERFFLDLPRAVKKQCALEVRCGGVRNCGCRQKKLTLSFAVGASSEKSCLWRSKNVAHD